MRLNQNPLKEVSFNKFSGGYAGAKGVGSLDSDEALDLDNVVVLPSGGGFKNRPGNTELSRTGNLSTVTLAYQGLQSFKIGSSEYLVGVRGIGGGTDTCSETYLIGTSSSWTTRTTYTASGQSANTLFTIDRFKDLAIGVGGQLAPFKIDFSGAPSSITSGSLGGTPPNGTVLIIWNNRAWIGNTSSNPSKLFYSILNDPEDWSSSGSGFVEPSPGDGDELTAVCPISNNVLLFFKRNRTWQVVGRTDPFSAFPLFQDTGCIGKHAVVNVDGLVYFINSHGHMQITDGSKILDTKDLPTLDNARDLWETIPVSRRPYIQGTHQKGNGYEWIVWGVSSGSTQTTNNYAIIWDLINKCWLKCSTGYNGNCFATASDGTLYMGGYSGRVYEMAVEDKYTDDSGVAPSIDGSNLQVLPTNPIPVRWFWRSDDISLNSLINVVQVDRVNVLCQYDGTGQLKVSCGYDGYHDTASIVKTIVPSEFILGAGLNTLGVSILGGVRFSTETVRPLGRGQSFNVKFEGSDNITSEITKFTLSGRQAATKTKEAR
jgi:hypothetical protein